MVVYVVQPPRKTWGLGWSLDIYMEVIDNILSVNIKHE